MKNIKKTILLCLFVINGLFVFSQIERKWNLDKEQGSFNGYTSGWQEEGLPAMDGNLFIEAGIVPREYSFNVSAFVNQQDEKGRGFLLGINHNGQLVASLYAKDTIQTLISDQTLPLTKWSCVGMQYKKGKGMDLFINGEIVKTLSFSENIESCDTCPIWIGRSRNKNVVAYTDRTYKTVMRFNGMIDHLYISDRLPEVEARKLLILKSGKVGKQVFEMQQMPSANIPQGTFGAYYTRLRYTEGWESLWKVGEDPDVVVRFPDVPVKYVFWRGTGYIPAIVSENNIWMTDQSLEAWGGECFEAMGDKQCRYSHVRVIESTPARCVIHWRYPLSSVDHKILHEDETGWGDWADEYWTIYPDGIGIRKQILHSSHYQIGKWGYQFQETIVFNQPGTKPQDNLDVNAITLADMDGNEKTYSYENSVPKEFSEPRFHPIQMVNIKAKYRPFSIFCAERITEPFLFGWVDGYSVFPCWNHWPVSQIKSDGRNATQPDKPSHSSIAGTNSDKQIVEEGPNHTFLVRQMVGMTTNSVKSLIPLARSWNYAPEIKLETAAYENKGYDVYQRAYLLKKKSPNAVPLEFVVEASEERPLENLAVVIDKLSGVHCNVKLNGKQLIAGKDYEVGNVSTLENEKSIFWIKIKSSKAIKISIF